jgi:hypothetical protein
VKFPDAKSKYVFRTSGPPHVTLENCCPGYYDGYVADVNTSSIGWYKATVGKPWLISDGCDAPQQGCIIADAQIGADNHHSLYFMTLDPQAGARNVVLEKVVAGATCAPSDYWQ